MINEIDSTTHPDKLKEEKFVLEDKDYLLIKAIVSLTNEIEKLRTAYGR